MAEKDFQLQTLLNALEDEKSSKTLTHLEQDFYPNLREYLSELKDKLEDMGASTSSENERLRREYFKAKKIAERLFILRIKKISLSSLHQFSGVEKVKMDRMTDREGEFFNDMKILLKNIREEVFYGGYRRQASDEESPKEEKIQEMQESKKPEKIPQEKEEIQEAPGDLEKGEVLIHVIEDMPAFVDLETTYNLKKEDVVTLREDIANVLISKGKARKVVLN